MDKSKIAKKTQKPIDEVEVDKVLTSDQEAGNSSTPAGEEVSKPISETQTEKNLIYIEDYLWHYSNLDVVSKTTMRMRVEEKLFRTLEEWNKLEQEIRGN